MRGEVLNYDVATGFGSIRGDDGARYMFDREALRSEEGIKAGVRVDFVAEDRRALDVIRLTASDAPAPAMTATGSFDLARVIQRTFGAIRDHWAVILGGATVLVGLPTAVMAYGQLDLVLNQALGMIGLVVVGGLFVFIGTYILQGMVVAVTVQGFNGRRIEFSEALGIGARMFLPLLGLAILMGLATGLGYVLLIVPGVILTVMWAAAAPVLVIEKRGITESFGRSRDLTRGHRWPIFGLLVIYFVASTVVGMVVGGVGMATGGSFLDGSPLLAVNVITSVVTNILTSVISSAGVAALYYELRTAKEGVGPEQLAAVFD